MKAAWQVARRIGPKEAGRGYGSRAGAGWTVAEAEGLLSRTCGGESAGPRDRVLTKRHQAMR